MKLLIHRLFQSASTCDAPGRQHTSFQPVRRTQQTLTDTRKKPTSTISLKASWLRGWQ